MKRLSQTLQRLLRRVERRAVADRISLGRAMRMLTGPGGAGDRAPGEPTLTEARAWPVPGWQRTLAAFRRPDGLWHVDLGRRLGAHCGLSTRFRACNGFICSAQLRLGASLPTTSDSAGAIRCSRCCWRWKAERGQGRAVPSRGAGLAARRLGRGDSAICASTSDAIIVPSIHGADRDDCWTTSRTISRMDFVITSYGFSRVHPGRSVPHVRD